MIVEAPHPNQAKWCLSVANQGLERLLLQNPSKNV
ncbi:hypothetical protein ACHAWT_007495 [Skeletonema menzelii]